MDKNLALDFVRVTEAAALACARWMGKGDANAADQAAVEAMRTVFDAVDIDGTIVIGEGERDEAPMLYIGEKVGTGTKRMKVDIALDPLECTNSVAFGRHNAISVLAAAEAGNILHAPDTYMEKIAVGPEAKDVIDLGESVETNLKRIAKAKNYDITDLTVVILERERHKDLISRVRKTGARIHLILDGDVSAAMATALPGTGVDVLMGTGGAPEGVLAAAALRCLGGAIQGRLVPRNPQEAARCKQMGIKNINKIFKTEELARGNNIMLAATGVTDGDMLKGVRYTSTGAYTHSIVMRSKSGTIRFISTEHHFTEEPDYH
ncbi:MAG: fructose-bisphosphatase, class II [candidate division Zixibacteria bacterium RBG_16_53_22]|nr:MAG: fructose-bisphosphatase, class II [candidate division Zixibacteria bacterium RBG_16_53_22]